MGSSPMSGIRACGVMAAALALEASEAIRGGSSPSRRI